MNLDLLASVLGDQPTHNAVLYMAGSMVGAVAHWTAKWLNDEVRCIADMARTERKRTLASIAAQLSAAYLVVSAGALETVVPGAAFFSGIFQGTALDALVNKGKREPWPEGKRETKRAKQEGQA